MKRRKFALLAVIAAFLSGLCGCKGKHLLDGPGMVNDQPWKAFTLSQSNSDSWLTVEQGDFAFLLTGECRDEQGNTYTIAEGVEISAADLQFLKNLQLHELADADCDGEAKLVLTYMDGKQRQKALSSDAATQIYQQFLPYFTKN